MSRSTVRSILLSAGLPSPRYRRPPRHRHRRQRMPQEGMLLQLDGSYHAWLEDRGPKLTLLLAVDDAILPRWKDQMECSASKRIRMDTSCC